MRRGAGAPCPEPVLLGSSRRTPDGFVLEADGAAYRFEDRIDSGAARVHRAVYLSRPDVAVIRQSADSRLSAVALAGEKLLPWLDDFAQLVGLSANCALGAGPDQIVRALGKRRGVLVSGGGALCCAATEDDARAAELVMIKDAQAQIGARFIGGGKPISLPDCILMNFVYNKSYAKKAGVRA
jgi:L-fuculose-phosphate aldolase